ncbi:MAG TPA: universal stress protein [Terriglobales bacterium]|jgi:nucleotide-binding universal stress UspA family protein|nr:universal stress protein [Terriglobales bacterium]
MSFQRILIALDESPISVHALEVGSELAKGLAAAQIALVHVLDPKIAYAPEGGLPASTVLDEYREQGRRLLRRASLRIGEPQPWEYLVEGNASRKIVSTAEEWNADLIVIGSHGRSGIVRAFLGSTAESVIRQARIPVLTVRGTA